MLEATAGGLSRSAGASPSQSPSRGTRLQQKARALAADLDSKLSFALKARQALPSSTWRPEEVALPARKSLPSAPVVNQAVPLKAVLQSPKTTLPAEAFQERRAETGPVPRTEATEKKLEELVQRLQVEQKARQVFEEEMQKKLQVSMDAALQKLFQAMETHGGSAQRSGAKDQLQEEMALLSRTLEEKLAVSQENQSQVSQSCKAEARLSITGPLLLCALTFHSLVEGLSLGAAKDQDVLDLFFPIMAHKGIAAFTLGINWNGIRGYWLAMLFFSILSPLGVLIGQRKAARRACFCRYPLAPFST